MSCAPLGCPGWALREKKKGETTAVDTARTMIGRGMRRTRRPRLGLIERSLIEGSLIERSLNECNFAGICRDLALQVRSAISKTVRNEPCVSQGRPYILEVTSGRPGFSYLSVSHFDLA